MTSIVRRSQLHARSLCPDFAEELLSDLTTREWSGNFRELERTACDMFWRIDLLQQGTATPDLVDHAPSPSAQASPLARSPVVAAVERALLHHAFVLSRAAADLKDFKIGTTNTLRKFVLEHQHHFSKPTLDDPRFKALIRNRQNRTTSGP